MYVVMHAAHNTLLLFVRRVTLRHGNMQLSTTSRAKQQPGCRMRHARRCDRHLCHCCCDSGLPRSAFAVELSRHLLLLLLGLKPRMPWSVLHVQHHCEPGHLHTLILQMHNVSATCAGILWG